jgi:hypothetical protein
MQGGLVLFSHFTDIFFENVLFFAQMSFLYGLEEIVPFTAVLVACGVSGQLWMYC